MQIKKLLTLKIIFLLFGVMVFSCTIPAESKKESVTVLTLQVDIGDISTSSSSSQISSSTQSSQNNQSSSQSSSQLSSVFSSNFNSLSSTKSTIEIPRTGGLNFTVLAATTGLIVFSFIFYKTRRRKLKEPMK